MQRYWVYILASKPYGTLYIGVTNGLIKRIEDHRAGIGSAFSRRYKIHTLVWHEDFVDIEEAIQREKSLKRYLRAWKINLIERENPHWEDLYPSMAGVKPIPAHWQPQPDGSSGRAREARLPADDKLAWVRVYTHRRTRAAYASNASPKRALSAASSDGI